MSEQNIGMEREVRLYFKKIMKTVSVVLVWTMTMATVGLFMKWAYITDGIRWQNIVFYTVLPLTFFLVLRIFFRTWAKRA